MNFVPSMSESHNINNYDPDFIRRYHQGTLSPQERHALEKAALEDPFLADALEGYAAVATTDADMTDLREKLQSRVQGAKIVRMTRRISWLRIAAVLLVMAGAGIPAYVFLFRNTEKNNIAQETPVKPAAPASNGNAQPQNGSTQILTDSISHGQYKKPTAVHDTATVLTQDKFAATKSEDANPKQDEQLERSVVSAPAASDNAPQTSGYTGTKDLTNTPPKSDVLKRKESADRDNIAYFNNGSGSINVKPRQVNVPAQQVTFKADSLSSIAGKLDVKFLNTDKNRMNNGLVYNFNNFRGRVTDNNNNPLPFANIVNVEDNVGTYSDARGYFNLTSPDSILNVQVRSIGFNASNTYLRNNLLNNQITLQNDQSISPLVLNTKKVNAGLHASNNNLKLTEPEPSDGWDNYDTYLANNVNIPDEYKTQRSEGGGEVEVSFEVDKNGEPVNIKVERSLCSSCDKEAIRLIKEGPKWKRKAKNGRTTVKISF